MTLVIGFMSKEGFSVVADTRFGSNRLIVAEAGPKVFSVPIILNIWQDGRESLKRHLPNMGFAFAGNTFAGQSTHAVASTYLQNLLVEAFDAGPTVHEVVELYARCAKLVVDERRRWQRTDIHLFEAIVFGRSGPSAKSQAFALYVSIGEDAAAAVTVEEVAADSLLFVTLGDGDEQVKAQVEAGLKNNEPILPWDLLQAVITDQKVATVGGSMQVAVSTASGVELRPVLTLATDGVRDLNILGFGLTEIGLMGRYFPAGTHVAIG